MVIMHGIGTKMSMFIRTDFFTKGQRQCRGERAFETNVLAQLAVHVLKNEPGSIPCNIYINSKWNTDINVKSKTTKFTE